ncbi:addiction module antidote protein [Rhodoferax antarcticus]|nr:addiction module antidote protein [Rhodoferax antarcticus]
MNPTAAAQLGIKPFEAADYLQSDEDCAQYLQACMDEAPEDAALFTKAVGDIARARGMMQLARDTGITREGLLKFDTVFPNSWFSRPGLPMNSTTYVDFLVESKKCM